MKDPKVERHLEATLQMLKERHGDDFTFLLVARCDRPSVKVDGTVYIVGNETEIKLVTGVLKSIVDQGLYPEGDDCGDSGRVD